MSVISSPTHLLLQAELQARLGSDAAVVCTGVDGDPKTLWPEERGAIARAVPKRQREFAAGRSAARTAMQRLNWPASAIPAHSDRSPDWPPGLVGSIAHSADTCIAVVGCRNPWASIGIDIEPDQGIDESLWGIICTPDELRELDAKGHRHMAVLVKRAFVAKEAFYKWHYPQHRIVLDFTDVSITWESNGSGFKVVSTSLDKQDSIAAGCGKVFSMCGSVVACVFSWENLNAVAVPQP